MKKMLGLMLVMLAVAFGGCGSKEASDSVKTPSAKESINPIIYKKGDLWNDEYLLKVYKAVIKYEKLEADGIMETYKNIASKYEVGLQDLIDVKIASMNNSERYYKYKESYETTMNLDGDKYHRTRFNRIFYGDIQEVMYDEVNKVKSGENPVTKVELKTLVKDYPGITEIMGYYDYTPGQEIDDDMLYEIMDEIVYTEYYSKKTTLKSDDPTSIPTVVNAAVMVFGKEVLDKYTFVKRLLEISYLGYNFNIYGFNGVDRTKDKLGVIPEERYVAGWKLYEEEKANKRKNNN